ncbi:hypothetical protein [Aminipila terrae]|uniref:Uncharacterized protein n=1 Tax=Aminipila terrae TaxID=2697030 RepID=A0A6P1MS33_9FIRM|nr:hypothetical protein [Aminipila terrae]QHI73815.1 hypothetical protein Ami3637_16760 [Aminipila terrae]
MQNALDQKQVHFPANMEYDYDIIEVYRKVRKSEEPISQNDFYSQAECFLINGVKHPKLDLQNIEFYSCSFFKNMSVLKRVMKLPPHDKRIIIGELNKEAGSVVNEEDDDHVQCWLYKNSTLWDNNKFKRVE